MKLSYGISISLMMLYYIGVANAEMCDKIPNKDCCYKDALFIKVDCCIKNHVVDNIIQTIPCKCICHGKWYIGQKVWTTNAGSGKVLSINDLTDSHYPIRVKCGNGISTYTKDGMRFKNDSIPALYAEKMKIVPVRLKNYFDLGDHVGFNDDSIRLIGSDESFCGKIVDKIDSNYSNKQYLIESCKDKDLRTIDIVCLRKLESCKSDYPFISQTIGTDTPQIIPDVKWYASPIFYNFDKLSPDLFYLDTCTAPDVIIGLRSDDSTGKYGTVVWKKRE